MVFLYIGFTLSHYEHLKDKHMVSMVTWVTACLSAMVTLVTWVVVYCGGSSMCRWLVIIPCVLGSKNEG